METWFLAKIMSISILPDIQTIHKDNYAYAYRRIYVVRVLFDSRGDGRATKRKTIPVNISNNLRPYWGMVDEFNDDAGIDWDVVYWTSFAEREYCEYR